MRMRHGFWVLLLLVVSSNGLMAKVERIMPSKVRKDYIERLEHFLKYQDSDLKASISEVVNPFFSSSPLSWLGFPTKTGCRPWVRFCRGRCPVRL